MSFKTFNRYLVCTLLQGSSQEKYTFLCRIYLPSRTNNIFLSEDENLCQLSRGTTREIPTDLFSVNINECGPLRWVLVPLEKWKSGTHDNDDDNII